MICGIGLDSELMAFTSRMILKLGLWNCCTNRIASAAVLMKLVSLGDNGSRQIVKPRSDAQATDARTAAVAHSQACRGEVPSRTLRCLGEPRTRTWPPRSAQKSTRSHRYLLVRSRIAGSGW